MWFVVKFREGRSRTTTDEYPHVMLVQDNWDDYGYRTTFRATLHLTSDESVDLGNVKILHRAQTEGYTPMPRQAFQDLGSDYCSLGDNLGYYEELFKRGRQIYRPYLRGLGDVAYSDEVRAAFEDLEGYKVSLLRFSGSERTIADAAKLFARAKPVSKRRSAGFKVKFKTQVAHDANAFIIDFDFQRRGSLPNRINVLIGYNGTGKTMLLSNLATVASGYGYSRKEDLLEKRAGRFVGTQPPFKTVVVVSYSAFDTFVIPGRTEVEKTRLRDEGGIFGYIYCGLRVRTEDNEEDEGESYRLRTPQEIETEFLTALARVREADRLDALLEILRPLLRDASFQRIGLTQLYADRNDGNAELFRSLSSGHKVVLKIVTELTAHVDENQPTLVLIDEPETHLHPPLLAALLKGVRACLERFDGYAVIATHSPVVLQETPSRYVHVLRRIGDQSKVVNASIETFGENIGVITQDVFNLDDGSTDWHDTLRSLARRRGLNEIEAMFERRLGFAPRSYVISVHDEAEE
jgi:predicted ATPase